MNDYYDQELGDFTDGSEVPVMYPPELIEVFRTYALNDKEAIGTDGMIQLVADLGYKLEDLVTICLAKLLHCVSLADGISKEQFLSSWYMQGCTTIRQMREVLQNLERKLQTDADYLSEIYKYTFDLALDPGKRNLDIETGLEYWRLFFKSEYPIHVDEALVDSWLDFFKNENSAYITRDTWLMILEFFRKFPTFQDVGEKYSEADAWPYIIDEYYEYLKAKGLA